MLTSNQSSGVDPSVEAHVKKVEEENRRMRHAIGELSTLNELSSAIGALHNSNEIIEIITRTSVRAVGAEQGVVTLGGSEPQDIHLTLARAMATSASTEKYHITQALLGWMQINKKPLLLNYPREDARFKGERWDDAIRSLLSVPLIVKGELKGALTVYNKKREGGFTDEDQRLLAIIAMQSAQVVENARLYEQEKSLIAMREQLQIAARIQSDLLPKSAPKLPGYDIAGRSIAAQEVGGDYFDFMPLGEMSLAHCLGDVSGKGLPASLLMANLQATLRAQTPLGLSPGECLTRSNKLLYESTSDEKFVTMYYGILDASNHVLTYSSAGHEHPFFFSADGQVRRLATGGTILSMFVQATYNEESIPFAVGDLLLVYSDGISEAMNTRGEQFGETRLEEVVRGLRNSSSEEILSGIIAAVKLYTRGAVQSDDITLIAVRRLV